MQSLQSAEYELWIDRTAASDIKVAKHSFPAASNTVKEQLQVVTVFQKFEKCETPIEMIKDPFAKML